MKIFIDTNIFLDVLLKRENYKESLIVLNSCYENIFEAYICDITILNIDYIASKQFKDIKEFLQIVNQLFNVIGADNKIFDMAFELDNNDLEDSVGYICAKLNECSVIVSNDKNFYKDDITVLSSVEFVKKFL